MCQSPFEKQPHFHALQLWSCQFILKPKETFILTKNANLVDHIAFAGRIVEWSVKGLRYENFYLFRRQHLARRIGRNWRRCRCCRHWRCYRRRRRRGRRRCPWLKYCGRHYEGLLIRFRINSWNWNLITLQQNHLFFCMHACHKLHSKHLYWCDLSLIWL